MANVKISQLPSLSTMTDLAQIPVVSSGTTYQITGANLSSYFGGGGVYGNANVVANLAALGSNPVSTTGNVTGGNLTTAGIANIATLAVTGSVTVQGSIGVSSFLSATSNVTGGNLRTSGTISATGNITSGNISTGVITLTNGAVIKDIAGNAVAFGQGAGAAGINTVAVGNTAGNYLQGANAVAVGDRSGAYTQGAGAVAVGQFAGNYLQGANAVAIGNSAGYTGQGLAAVAIGTLAGATNQGNNSIIINATAANLEQTTANTFTVAPVRNDVANTANLMFYNATSKEITYGNVVSVAGNITGGNINTGGKILGNYTFAQSGATSAYATQRVLQYVPGTGVVTYSNYIDASSIYITGYAIEIHVSPSALNNDGNGTIGTPVKTIARAKELLAQAFETSSAGQRNTIILHPGDYAENVTIDTQYTVLTTHELVGKNTTLSGTLTITKGCTIDGLKMTNLVISADNTTGSVDIIGCTVTTATTKTSTAYTVFRGCDLSTSTMSITGGGTTVLSGGNYFTLAVNNAAAGVLAKAVISMGPVTQTAGTLQLSDTLIYAGANTANAITQSAGSVITVNNCQTLIPDLTNVARNSFGGFYSILNAVYDKANSTFAGTSLNSILYSQYINADNISATGNITGGNITTAGVLKISGSSSYIDVAGTGFIQNAGMGEMQISTVAGRPLIINTNAGAYGWNFGTAGNLTLPNGGTLSGTGNITAGYFFGNGSQLTGITAVSSYGNANVVANLAALGTNPISTTGNITGGNILVGIFQLLNNGDAQVGNLTVSNGPGVGNLVVGNIISATGNILTSGNISATANITGGNISATNHTGTTVSVTGNITGGNILAGSGVISTGGNVNGAIFNGNVAFGTGTVSGTGNITANNIAV